MTEKVDSLGVTKIDVDKIHTRCFDPTVSSSAINFLFILLSGYVRKLASFPGLRTAFVEAIRKQ